MKLKKFIPYTIKRPIRRYLNFRVLKTAYLNDLKRFDASMIDGKDKLNDKQLHAKITIYYHSLEKGLSNINFRPGFGRKVVLELIQLLINYNDGGYNQSNTAYISGILAIKAYLDKHNSLMIQTHNLDVFLKDIQNKLSLIELNNSNELNGGSLHIDRDSITDKSKSNFRDLSSVRFSVRDYSDYKVSISTIQDAINIASKTPSVCNRQPRAFFCHI